MIVFSRKKNESIVINSDITITVVEIRGDKVRLAIVAPKEVPVYRQEVFDAIHGREVCAPTPAPLPADPPIIRPAAVAPAPAPPAVELTPRQGRWLDRLAAALRARTGAVISPSTLV